MSRPATQDTSAESAPELTVENRLLALENMVALATAVVEWRAAATDDGRAGVWYGLRDVLDDASRHLAAIEDALPGDAFGTAAPARPRRAS